MVKSCLVGAGLIDKGFCILRLGLVVGFYFIWLAFSVGTNS